MQRIGFRSVLANAALLLRRLTFTVLIHEGWPQEKWMLCLATTSYQSQPTLFLILNALTHHSHAAEAQLSAIHIRMPK